jgi:hypothetical protein
MPLSAGDRLGRYEVLGPLGAGGMGEVPKLFTRLRGTLITRYTNNRKWGEGS